MVRSFYAYGNNGARVTVLIFTEVTAAGEKEQVLRTDRGATVIRLEKGKYRMLSEFFGDQLLTTDDPDAP